MSINQEGRIKKSTHHSLPSAVPLGESIDSGNDQKEDVGKISNAAAVPQPTISPLKPFINPVSHNAAPKKKSVLKGEQLMIDNNRMLDLLLEKMTQIERSIKAIEKQTSKKKFMEKHIKACAAAKRKRPKQMPVPSNNSSVLPDRLELPFSPVSCLFEMEILEEKAKDIHFVNYVKMQVNRLVRFDLEERKVKLYFRRILDYFFTRSFLTQCTWSGRVGPINGTSKGLEKKIRFKDFSYVINLFYEVAKHANPSICKESTESFFKGILKQSTYRTISAPQKKTSPVADGAIVIKDEEMLSILNTIENVESYEVVEFDPLEIKTELDT
ncbi:uncharacterized protein LOC118459076 isoform X3 [Anopheles albimanus]|nr:uncharacterized protein LOC118459076 isoform X3 [Anopheles albimanus]